MPSQKRQRQRARQQQKREAAKAAQRRAARRRQIIGVAALVVVIFGIAFVISRGGDDDGTEVGTGDGPTTTEQTDDKRQTGDLEAAFDYEAGSAECPPVDGSAERKISFDGPPQKCIDLDKDYSAIIETDVGEIEVDLLERRAPVTVNNFVFLARYQFYDGVPFHRVVKDFVVQGGDAQNEDGTGGPGYEFKDELPSPGDYEEGSLAMANSGPNTNGSQFFIVVSDEAAETLVQAVGGSANYSLFGDVTAGMDVVRRIEADGSASGAGTPATVHSIRKVTIFER